MISHYFGHSNSDNFSLGGFILKKEQDRTSEGLNQIFEVINAKGDTGELEKIVEHNDVSDEDQN
ncbi:hypothetical protein BIV60_04695 [Bacillus sp. MUM 116]|nr:hypothetical protein BIV60_04695 [Bacillus sp. MUM 116]